MSLRRRATLLGLVTVGLVGLAAAAWTVSDRVERENEFCLGCHLTSQVRLHDSIGRDFERRPPASLAARHAQVGAGEGEGFRCIECHGGTSWPGRFRVKLMAASDAFWYATGRFEEPERMAWPLWDEDCRKCHPSFDAVRRDWESIVFHEVSDHDGELGVACVDCHRVHDTSVDPDHSFLRAGHVRTQCARCHSDFRDEE
jgi:nitrate/TMAO reductase-like tetraheme cytochrome c subunit